MFKKILITLVTGLAIIYGCGVYYFHGHFLPNTSVGNLDIGFMSEEEAKEAIFGNAYNYKLTIAGDVTVDTVAGSDIDLTFVPGEDFQQILDTQNTFLWPASLIQENLYEISVVYDNEKLNKIIDTLNCFTSERIVNSQDAYIEKENGSYHIVEEIHGNIPEKETLVNEIIACIQTGETDMIISAYEEPTVTSSSAAITKAMDEINQILSEKITLVSPYEKYTLSENDISDCIIYHDGKVEINMDAVQSLVSNIIAGKFNTVGKERQITTIGSGTFDISGGIYGYRVDEEEETQKLAEDILAGKDIQRQPIYSREETYDFNNGIGNTYIEVSIPQQKVWLVYAGEVILITDCVTGNESEGNGTPTGVYWVEFKKKDYQMEQFNAFVNFWIPIDTTTGVGLHDATWRSSFGGDIYKNDGSHGCINLPYDAAKTIYEYSFGTMPVIVH